MQLTVTPEDDFSSLQTEGGAEYVACTAWEHDTTFWKMTIIMDFDLVCDVSLECLLINTKSRASCFISVLEAKASRPKAIQVMRLLP